MLQKQCSAHWYFYALFTHTPSRKVGNSIVGRKTSWPKEIGSSRRSKEQRSHRQQGSRLAKRLQPKGVLATTGTLPAAAVRTLTQSASNQICRPSNQSVALRQSSTAEQKEELGTSQPELGIGGERPLVEDARDGAAASLRRSSPDLVLARRPWAQPPRQGDAPPVGRRARPPARTASLPSLAPACLPAASSGRWIKGRQSDTGIAA